MLDKIKEYLKDLFKEPEIVESAEIPSTSPSTRNFEEVYNMFLNGVKDTEQQNLMRIRESTPMDIQNCSTCYGCKHHTKEGGIV